MVGSGWIHWTQEEFETDEGQTILQELGIKDDYEGVGHCLVGYIDGMYRGQNLAETGKCSGRNKKGK